jgi:hypothetical protein
LADRIVFVLEQNVQNTKLEKSKAQQHALIGGLVLLIGLLGIIYNRFRIIHQQIFATKDVGKGTGL